MKDQTIFIIVIAIIIIAMVIYFYNENKKEKLQQGGFVGMGKMQKINALGIDMNNTTPQCREWIYCRPDEYGVQVCHKAFTDCLKSIKKI